MPGRPKMRALTAPLYCKKMNGSNGNIPFNFHWDGASSGIFAFIFPRHNHPVATCRHDWRCFHAKSPKERAWADREFENDIGTTSWWITKKIGHIGVRIGAALGIGANYRHGGGI